MNDRPTKLNVQGTEWEVEWKDAPPEGPPNAEWGECDSGKFRITILCSGQRTQDVDTYMHEILHIAEEHGVLFDINDDKADYKISQLARFLAQVMVDNNLINL